MEFGSKPNNHEKISWGSKVRNIVEETKEMSKEQILEEYVEAMARHNVLQEDKEKNKESILEQKNRAFALVASHSSISLDKNVNEKIAEREKELLVKK